MDGTWYKEGAGFASDQGPGDDGEMDDEHMHLLAEQAAMEDSGRNLNE